MAAAAVVVGGMRERHTDQRLPPTGGEQRVHALGSQSGIDLRISLGVTAAQLQQIAAPGPIDGLSPEGRRRHRRRIDRHRHRHRQREAPQHSRTGADHSQQFGLAVQVPARPAPNSAQAADPVDVRYVNQTIYLRADMPTLLNDLGQEPLAGRGASGTRPRAPNSTSRGFAALGQGNWVSVPASALSGLLRACTAVARAAGRVEPSTSGQMASELTRVHREHDGTPRPARKGGRTHYTRRWRSPVRPARSSGAAGLVRDHAGGVLAWQADQSRHRPDPRRPEGGGRLWVKDNKVQEIDIDLNQFDHQFTSRCRCGS